MNSLIVQSTEAIGLIGGGRATPEALELLRTLCRRIVAADGGAATALAEGLGPDAVIGDLDSLDAATRAALDPAIVHQVAEQETTDFDKALRSIEAPVILGAGVLGPRLDHGLAALNALVRHPSRRCIVVGEEEAVFLCPPVLRLDLVPGTRVSLFPMGAVEGWSEGLEWPVRGVNFAPDGPIGTSNRATGPMSLQVTAPKLLAMLPVAETAAVVRAFGATVATWPARAG